MILAHPYYIAKQPNEIRNDGSLPYTIGYVYYTIIDTIVHINLYLLYGTSDSITKWIRLDRVQKALLHGILDIPRMYMEKIFPSQLTYPNRDITSLIYMLMVNYSMLSNPRCVYNLAIDNEPLLQSPH